MIYRVLSALLPQWQRTIQQPKRIVLIRPCCIGDVVMATAALTALRRYYPDAHITWAVGGWSRQAVEGHPDLDDILDTGDAANPARDVRGFARLLRGGSFDLAVSLVRSPLMSAAVWLSGIPYRVGIDSAGRGFGYNIRVAVDPTARRHEVDIYLDVVWALVGETADIVPNFHPTDEEVRQAQTLLAEHNITGAYLVVNPSGGKNPGAQMDAKRYPPKQFAQVVNALAPELGFEHVVIITGPDDATLAAQVSESLALPFTVFAGTLSFGQVRALAKEAVLYIGNDTGLTHIAAAAGAQTAMILGPTDPARYRAYSPRAVALWKDYALPIGGFASGAPPSWDWRQDGISPQNVVSQILQQFHQL